MEHRDAAVECFLLGNGEAGAYATVAAAVVPLSSQGKSGFNLCEEFLDIFVLVGGGLGELDESILENIVSVRGRGSQVVKVGVKVLG